MLPWKNGLRGRTLFLLDSGPKAYSYRSEDRLSLKTAWDYIEMEFDENEVLNASGYTCGDAVEATLSIATRLSLRPSSRRL
jgi:hypothetical protein